MRNAAGLHVEPARRLRSLESRLLFAVIASLDYRFLTAGRTNVFNAERARNTDTGWSGLGGRGTDRVVVDRKSVV